MVNMGPESLADKSLDNKMLPRRQENRWAKVTSRGGEEKLIGHGGWLSLDKACSVPPAVVINNQEIGGML